MAEIAARRRAQGLVTVMASADRSLHALQDALLSWGERLPAVAWLGGTALSSLSVSGIPTAILVDDRGIVRAVHMGTGIGLKPWLRVIDEVLAQSRGEGPRRDLAEWFAPKPAVTPTVKKAGGDAAPAPSKAKVKQPPSKVKPKVRAKARGAKASTVVTKRRASTAKPTPSKRRNPRSKASKRKASKRKASKRKASKRKASKRKSSKR